MLPPHPTWVRYRAIKIHIIIIIIIIVIITIVIIIIIISIIRSSSIIMFTKTVMFQTQL